MTSGIEQYKSNRDSLATLEMEQKYSSSKQDKTSEIETLRASIDTFLVQFEPIRTNLIDLNTQNPAPFSNDTILNYQSYLKRNDIHLTDKCKNYKASIPMDSIVGTSQPYGGDATWEDCLNGTWLKRINKRLVELRKNPIYYLDDAPKIEMSFIKVEDKYFIDQGKHRTVIAKFFEHFNPHLFPDSPLKNIAITEYFIDFEYQEMKQSIEAIAKRYPLLRFQLEHTTELDDPRFLYIREKRNYGDMACFTRGQYKDVINALTKPSLRDKWISNRAFENSSIYDFISYSQCFISLFD